MAADGLPTLYSPATLCTATEPQISLVPSLVRVAQNLEDATLRNFGNYDSTSTDSSSKPRWRYRRAAASRSSLYFETDEKLHVDP